MLNREVSGALALEVRRQCVGLDLLNKCIGRAERDNTGLIALLTTPIIISNRQNAFQRLRDCSKSNAQGPPLSGPFARRCADGHSARKSILHGGNCGLASGTLHRVAPAAVR